MTLHKGARGGLPVRRSASWLGYGGALVLLVLNDGWLKHAGLGAPWLTGKLSDFCGVVVGTCALAMLVRARSQTALVACFAAVALPFAAIKVSSECAAWVERASALTSMPWKIRVDATDLCALLIAPLALHIARALCEESQHTEQHRADWRARVLALIGMVACAGSGVDRTAQSTSPYLVNRTADPIHVEVSRLAMSALTPAACEVLWKLSENVLRESDFVVHETRSVPHNGILPLGGCISRFATLGLVRAVVAEPSTTRSLPGATVSEGELADETGLVLVEQDGNTVGLRAGNGVRLQELASETKTTEPTACAAAAVPRLSVSTIGPSITLARIVARRSVGDHCLGLVLSTRDEPPPTDCDAAPPGDDEDAGTPGLSACELQGRQSITLCMPEELVPFRVGEDVWVNLYERFGALIIGDTATMVATRFFAQTAPDHLEPIDLKNVRGELVSNPRVELTPSSCGVVRDACGALWQPQDMHLNGIRVDAGTPTLVDGATYYLARAERRLFSNAACEPEDSLEAAGYFIVEWVEVHHYPARPR
jgi:hypothetical protein